MFHQQHEAVNVVDLVGPERGEDEVHLDEDGSEWQDAAQEDDHQRLHEPLLLWDRAGDGVDAARVVCNERENILAMGRGSARVRTEV